MDIKEIEWDGVKWLNWLRNEDTDEHSTEPPWSIQCGEFLDQLKNCQLLKKDFAPLSQSVS